MNIVLIVLSVSALIISILSSMNKAPLWVGVVLVAIVQAVIALQGWR